MIVIKHRYVAEQFMNGRWRPRAESDDRELLAEFMANAGDKYRIVDMLENGTEHSL